MNKIMLSLVFGMSLGCVSLDAMKRSLPTIEEADTESSVDDGCSARQRGRTGLDIGCEVRSVIDALTQDLSDEDARPLMDVIKELLGVVGIRDEELLAMSMDELPLLSEDAYADFIAELGMNSKGDLAIIFESSPETLIMVTRVITKYLVMHAPQDSVLQIMQVFIGGDDVLQKFSAYRELATQENTGLIEAHKNVTFFWAIVELALRGVVGAKAFLVGLKAQAMVAALDFSQEEQEVLVPYLTRINTMADTMGFEAMIDGAMLVALVTSFRADPRAQATAAAAVADSDGDLSRLLGRMSLFGRHS